MSIKIGKLNLIWLYIYRKKKKIKYSTNNNYIINRINDKMHYNCRLFNFL